MTLDDGSNEREAHAGPLWAETNVIGSGERHRHAVEVVLVDSASGVSADEGGDVALPRIELNRHRRGPAVYSRARRSSGPTAMFMSVSPIGKFPSVTDMKVPPRRCLFC